MKKKFFMFVIVLIAVLLGIGVNKNHNIPATIPQFNNGDIIFQVSLSSQSQAIQRATKSQYSHCGIVYNINNKYYVYEAIQPVKLTLLDNWVARGKDSHYVVKRLKNSDKILDRETLSRMEKEGEKFLGKDYDLTFEWSDDKIYCSELIWKIYKRAANIEIGKLEKLKDFDLSDSIVQEKLKERYGDNIPMDEIVISPKSIFDSRLLITIYEN
jgi:Orthopoxvirus protein of unknown function (DUF830).